MASYRVEVTAEARKDLRRAPGHLRARILQVLHMLERNYSPPGSRRLDTAQLEETLPPDMSFWRVHLDTWRVIYIVDTEDQVVSILAIRQHPLYQYEDLRDLSQRRRP